MSNFSFSHSVFKRLVLQTPEKPGCVWERVKAQDLLRICGKELTLSQIIPGFHERTDGRTNGRMHGGHNAMTIACWPLARGAKNCKKRRKCWKPAFSPLPTMFKPYQRGTSPS